MKPLSRSLLLSTFLLFITHAGLCQCSVSLNASTTTACSGEAFIISVTTSGCGTGLQYLWSTGDMNSSISTSVVNQTNGNINAVYTITVTGSNGSSTASKTIPIRPELQFSITNAKPYICSQDSTLLIFNSNVSGVQYNYTAIPTDVSGAANGTGAVVKQRLNLTTIGSGQVLYNVTPRIANCYGQMQSATVQVIQKPQAFSSTLDTIICNGGTINIQLSSDQMGAVMNYISTAQAVTGHSSGSGNTINQTLNNFASDTSIVMYKVYASTLSCSSDTTVVTVRVLPAIEVQRNIASQQICSGEQTNISFNVFPAGTNVSWTAIQINVTGASAGNGNSIQQTLISSSVSGKAIYFVTGQNGNCISQTWKDTIFVTPRPDISYSPPGISSICSGTATGITLQSLFPGVSFDWIPMPSSITGASAGSGNVISQSLFNNALIADTLTYLAFSLLNNCSGDSALIQVRVKPVPALDMNPDTIVICSGNPVNIQINSSLPGTSVTWTVQAQNVNGWFNGSGNSVSQILSSGNQTGYATYTATGIFDGCISEPASAYVTVNACLGISELTESDVSIIQTDYFNIYLSGNQKATIRMIDFAGRLVYENLAPEKLTAIDLSSFRPGYYFLRITSGQLNKVKRIKVENRR